MSETPTIRVLSLGAGRQSTTLALLSAEGVLPKLDACIFADTGWEPERVYRHLDRLEQEVLNPAGIPLFRVSNGNLRDDVLNPNKMRSIPAHTLGPAYQVEIINEWQVCPDVQCGWRALRELPDSGFTLFDLPAYDLSDMTEAFDAAASLPESHEVCHSTGRVVARSHLETRRDRGMLNRRCTQLYKLNPILTQTRLLLGAKVGEEKPCTYCDGTGERVAPWRAKLNDHVSGPCSVCDGEGVLSRVGPAPAGRWAEQWIGFSADEVERVSGKGDTRYSRSRYPLLELGMTVTQCLAFLESRGWAGTEKSACIGCPFHGNAAWRRMRDTDPDSWQQAVAFDHAYRRGPGMVHERYLHISRVPLELAPIDRVQRIENLQPTMDDAAIEAEMTHLERGDPDGCSPWACRSGEPVASEEAAR